MALKEQFENLPGEKLRHELESLPGFNLRNELEKQSTWQLRSQLAEADSHIREAAIARAEYYIPAIEYSSIMPNIVPAMRPVESFLGLYLEFYMNSAEQGQMIYKRYTYGAGRPHLSFEQLKATPILLPPEAEIKRIVDAVSQAVPAIERQHVAADVQFSNVAGLRNAILASAFTGKLAPQDPTDEPASALLERIRAGRVESSKKTVARRAAGKSGQR